jgi:dUTP pyrophosphatase
LKQVKVLIKRLKKEVISLPEYMTQGSSGMDLFASLDEEVTLQPGERKMIPTGISLAIPEGFEGQIRPRSGLAIQRGITILNAPGTIDSDYRGEIKVLLINLGSEPYTVKNRDRIAQLVISPVSRANLVEVEELPSSERQEGGFGHTGI